MGIDVHIGEVDPLFYAVGIVSRLRVITERREKTPIVILAALRNAASGRPEGSPDVPIEAKHASESMIVEEGVLGVVICVDRVLGREGKAVAHTGAGRILIQPVHIDIEPSAFFFDGLSCHPPQTMTAAIFGSIVTEADSLPVDREARRPSAEEWNRRSERTATAAVASPVDSERSIG